MPSWVLKAKGMSHLGGMEYGEGDSSGPIRGQALGEMAEVPDWSQEESWRQMSLVSNFDIIHTA